MATTNTDTLVAIFTRNSIGNFNRIVIASFLNAFAMYIASSPKERD